MFKIKYGSVFDTPDTVIVHGCNCFNSMGAGIAVEVRNEFPKAYAVDQKTKKGDISKLGTYTQAVGTSKKYGKKRIINAYTQFTYWNRNKMFSQDAFNRIIESLATEYKSFSLPAIGLGLANGKPKQILDTLARHGKDCDITLYLLPNHGIPSSYLKRTGGSDGIHEKSSEK